MVHCDMMVNIDMVHDMTVTKYSYIKYTMTGQHERAE